MRKRPKKKFYRLNWNITAPEVRVIDEVGKQLGILKKHEALALAKKKETDLVEIAPFTSPPVCKLIDFKKFFYSEKKKIKKQKKESRSGRLKEIRLRPFISNHDYQYRLNQAKEFLKNGEKVKVTIRFFGREIAKKKFGFELIDRLLNDLGEGVNLERKPRLFGRNLEAQLAAKSNYGKKKGRKETKSEDQKNG